MGEAKTNKKSGKMRLESSSEVLTRQMTLPQRVADIATEGLKDFWRIAGMVREKPSLLAGVTEAWKPWCFMPARAVAAVILHIQQDRSKHSPSENVSVPRARLLGAISGWRMTKGVYVFDPSIAEAIFDSDVDDDLPEDLFLQLPEWCPYISVPGLEIMDGLFIHGFFAYVDDRGHSGSSYTPELSFEILVDTSVSTEFGLAPALIGNAELRRKLSYTESDHGYLTKALEVARKSEYLHLHLGVPLGQGKFSKVFFEESRKLARKNPDSATGKLLSDQNLESTFQTMAEKLGRVTSRLGSLLIYLVSEKADISSDDELGATRDKIMAEGRRGIRSRPAKQITPWKVGFRIGAEVRSFDSRLKSAGDENGIGHSMRPHVRRAHWHTFWTGPRSQPENRKKKIRWLPPTPVNVTSSDDLIPTMHKVVL